MEREKVAMDQSGISLLNSQPPVIAEIYGQSSKSYFFA